MSFYALALAVLVTFNFTPRDSIRVKKIANLSDTLEAHSVFEPTDATFGKNGNIYIFDNGKKKIHVFDRSFDHQYSFGKQGPGPGEFDRKVTELLFSPSGKIVALEKWERMVHYFNPNGKYIDSFFIQKEPSMSGVPQANRGFGIPLDIAVNQNGYVYITDRVWYYSRYKISVFDNDGSFIDSYLPQKNFVKYKKLEEEYKSAKDKQRATAKIMNKKQIRISFGEDNLPITGGRRDYILKKYTASFDLKWKSEMDFDPVKTAHAYRMVHNGNEGYNAAMGEGAVADINTNSNKIFVSVGSFEGSIRKEKLDQLKHWIDVFGQSGNHLARLLEDELPPLPRRQGYRIAVHDSRLLILGDTDLWIYKIVRDP